MSKITLEKIEAGIADGPYDASWDSLEAYEFPDWYMDGKFGIFIHWGPYCVPAFGNEWYARRMYEEGSKEFEHHRETYGSHEEFGYKDFIPMLTAEKFDAVEWAKLFKAAGANFVVPVAEHHDGFQMYESDLCQWNSVEKGPKRDIVGELGEAVRAEGMTLGVSSHRAEHWWFMNGGKHFPSDVQDPKYADLYGPAVGQGRPTEQYMDNPPDQEFLNDWLLRTCEIIDKYEPKLIWFDWWIQNMAFKPYLKKFAAYYYNAAEKWDKGPAVNYKYDAFPAGTAVFDIERGQVRRTHGLFWQNDTSVSKNSWGYIDGHDYKVANDIIGDLIDVVAKNGALLLNIGPKADGTIPAEEQEMLLEIGRWLQVNGEGIYGTRPWREAGEGPTQVPDGAFTDTHRTVFTSEDMRFTAKDGAVYAHVMAWPEDGKVRITTMGTDSIYALDRIDAIELLGQDVKPTWSIGAEALEIDLQGGAPTTSPLVLKIVGA